MYSSFIKRDRVMIRVALSLAWGFTALGGLGGIVVQPTVVTNEVGNLLPYLSSFAILIFGVVALVGVATNHYWLEWAAAWVAAGGAFAYIITVWFTVFTGNMNRLQGAGLFTALLFFYIYRIVSCAAHARKLRSIHDLINTGETQHA